MDKSKSKKAKIIFVVLLLFIAAGVGFIFYNYNIFSKDFHICRETFFEPVRTGISEDDYERVRENVSTFGTYACFLGFDEEKDEVFPDSSLRFRIGFFDKAGRLFVYPARIGGTRDDGNIYPIAFCRDTGESAVCGNISSSEFRQELDLGDSVFLNIIFEDRLPWAAANQTQKHQSTVAGIKKAISDGVGFPKVPGEDFVLQVSMATN